MVDTLIRNHNDLVKPEDTVIVVGDVCYQKRPDYLEAVRRFNGEKFLIRGNHDKVFTDEQLKPYFADIIAEGKGSFIDFAGLPCYATHYPSCGDKQRFNLVGHVHAAWKYQPNMYNIGVDANHFRPVNMFSIPNHYKAICEFYDDDVWAAYSEINTVWKPPIRGKPGTYFTPA
jgi:calcineurin-like phosphoesterase family protein